LQDSKVIKIGEGINLRTIYETRFKTSSINIRFYLPLSEEAASLRSIVPFLLVRSCEQYPDFTALKKKLCMLYGASLTAGVSKFADCHCLSVGIDFLDDRYAIGGENISRECTDLLTSVIFSPLLENGVFRSADVEAERRLLIEKIEAQKNNKRAYALQRAFEIMFEGSVQGINHLGSVQSASSLTAEEITAAWRSMIKTAHIEICALGAFDFEPVTSGFSSAFSNAEREYTKLPLPDNSFDITSVKEHTEQSDAQQAKLVIGFRTKIDNSDKKMSMAMRLMNVVLGGSAHSLFFTNVREKMSLCYYCSSLYNRHKGYLVVQSGLEQKDCETAKKAIFEQLELLQTGTVEQSFIDSAKLSAVNECLLINDSLSSLYSWYTAQAFDDEIVTPEEAAAQFSAVSTEDIYEAAKTLTLDTIYLLAPSEETEDEGGND
jgi:predicted Zn-dependent peptidase